MIWNHQIRKEENVLIYSAYVSVVDLNALTFLLFSVPICRFISTALKSGSKPTPIPFTPKTKGNFVSLVLGRGKSLTREISSNNRAKDLGWGLSLLEKRSSFVLLLQWSVLVKKSRIWRFKVVHQVKMNFWQIKTHIEFWFHPPVYVTLSKCSILPDKIPRMFCNIYFKNVFFQSFMLP